MLRRHTNTSPDLDGMSRKPRMTHRTSRRSGFSLIEILVVIVIIAILVSLLLAAVMRAMDAGVRTQNFSQIGEIGSAIGEAKRVLNLPQIPPGPFTLKQYYNGNEPELTYLLGAFPQLSWQPGTAGTGLIPGATNTTTQIVLDSNQTLLFFLTGGSVTNFTGFSTNPSQPFAPFTAGAQRKGPFLQISSKYFTTNPATTTGLVLQSTTSYAQVPTPSTVPTGVLQSFTVSAGQQPWLVDAYGLPYAYFASLNGKNGLYCAPPIAPNANSPAIALTTSIPQAYQLNFIGKNSPLGTNFLTPYYSNIATNTFINPQGFQIISSGKDGFFGYGGTVPPSTAEGYDDQANFSKTSLGGGIN
jgi:prepilin-type N-terminal cleavage/methylation domain-containing protein